MILKGKIIHNDEHVTIAQIKLISKFEYYYIPTNCTREFPLGSKVKITIEKINEQ